MPDIITVVFTPPDKAAGKNAFELACMDMGDKLNPMCTQINAAVTHINGQAADAQQSAIDAAEAQGFAESARDAAIAAQALSAAEYDPGAHLYALNDMAWSAGILYRCTSGYTSGPTLPASDAAHWTPMLTSLSAFNALQATVDTLRNVPAVPVSGAYTVTDSDRGRNLQINSTLTVPASLSVGTTFVVTNLGASSLQIAPGAGLTLRLAGTSKTGAVTLAGYSKATLSIEAAGLCMAAGAGLT